MNKGRKNNDSLAVQVAYIHGRIEGQIEAFAQSLNIPASELTARMGALLLGSQGGEFMGSSRRVPKLRGKTAAGDQAVEPMALVGRPRRKSSAGIKSYWAKMTPEQRRQEVARRQAVAVSKAKAAGKKKAA